MKPLQESILVDSMQSFRVNHAVLPFLDSPWHFHKDYELFFIIKSEGVRYVGDSIENFYPGDLVFMGPDLPHVWKNPSEYYENQKEIIAEAIVLQFREDAFGKYFFEIPEMKTIRRLLDFSKRGLKVFGKTSEEIGKELQKLVLERNSLQRLFIVLKILEKLSQSSEIQFLASESFDKIFNYSGSERMNKVFEFVTNNFKTEIKLNDISQAANMSKTAFCRYFKKHSLKSFTEYLNEIRINYACNLLFENRLSIAEISYECGFNSPSYFVRKFRAIKGQSPKEFRSRFRTIMYDY